MVGDGGFRVVGLLDRLISCKIIKHHLVVLFEPREVVHRTTHVIIVVLIAQLVCIGLGNFAESLLLVELVDQFSVSLNDFWYEASLAAEEVSFNCLNAILWECHVIERKRINGVWADQRVANRQVLHGLNGNKVLGSVTKVEDAGDRPE